MFFLDIPSTSQMLQFETESEVMAAYYATPLECAVYNDDDCIAEKYHIEGDDIGMEEQLYEDAEYVTI